MSIDYQERIPNNVNLAEDRRLQRALEKWQPGYQQWWKELGPTGSTENFWLPREALRAAAGAEDPLALASSLAAAARRGLAAVCRAVVEA